MFQPGGPKFSFFFGLTAAVAGDRANTLGIMSDKAQYPATANQHSSIWFMTLVSNDGRFKDYFCTFVRHGHAHARRTGTHARYLAVRCVYY